MTDSSKHIVGPTERREEQTQDEALVGLRIPVHLAEWRKWLARQLLDGDHLDGDEAASVVAFHPKIKDAWSKADAILASDGGREMVRELVEALERAARDWASGKDKGGAMLRDAARAFAENRE